MRINKPEKCLYVEVIVPMALYGAEAWVIRSAGRRHVHALEMKCFRILVVVSPMDKVGNKEGRSRAGFVMELARREY